VFMMRVLHIIILVSGALFTMNAQQATTAVESLIEGNWRFLHIQNAAGNNILPVAVHDTFILNSNGQFVYHLEAKNNLYAKGRWEYNNDTLTLYYAAPSDTVRYYRITLSETGDTLCLHESGIEYCFFRPVNKQIVNNITVPRNGVSIWWLLLIFGFAGKHSPYLINMEPLCVSIDREQYFAGICKYEHLL
jgi:hypothetical protein